ncbi:MAG: NAD(+) diphosphatase [Candidatus Nanopelagicaceae bacterium]|nr:NAD(+) diphosphatase [Candidatus Nanopelagicaceae bacterium]
MSAINQDPSLIDRAGELRSDPATLAELLKRGKVLAVGAGKVSADLSTGNLVFPGSASEENYFLGIDRATDTPYFASHVEESEELVSLREIGAALSPLEIGLALHAVALSNWHSAHPRCSKCGAGTTSSLGGAVRVCDECEAQHHPRTDSAVIVLVRDADDRILLGRQAVWPVGRFSTFAGFLEPGETFEQCVSREVFEESGVTVSQINYLGSQPWPFPASIMIAFEAVINDPAAARPDGEEIVELRWYSRAQMRTAMEDGTLLLPPIISVARKMIERWFGAEHGEFVGQSLTGGESWR